MRLLAKYFVSIVLISIAVPVWASDLLMVRTQQRFPEAMLTLQTSVKEHGYEVTRVQRIDIGLTGKGYKTDKYRVVFVGKPEEIRYLVNKYPVLAAYMPPKISIFAEHGETVLVTANPKIYADMIDDEKDKIIFKRWENDIYSVFDDIRNAAE
ncbi:MAG: DUF302 domain-containing protein [Gammaproteobacteria bacterium]